MSQTLTIGVLVLQGAFAEHEYALQQCLECNIEEFKDLQLNVVKIRKPDDLQGCVGLIIPGGESTTMAIFLRRNNFLELLTNWVHGNGQGKPFVWGTCAGLILLSNNVEETMKGGQIKIGGLDITTTRNVYGRQTESFEALIDLKSQELMNITAGSEIDGDKYYGIFIRAPGVKSVDSDNVEVLASHHTTDGNSRVVAVKQGHLMATSFHPELTEDYRWHAYFLHNVLKTLNGEG